MNIPKAFKPLFDHEELGKGLPVAPWILPPLPLVRSYVIPSEDDHILLDRDYSQQELRVLGHFEDGPLREAYGAEPWMDIHTLATGMINEMLHAKFERSPIKTIGFGLIYGMGINLLASKADITPDQARNVKAAYLQIFPGLQTLQDGLKERARCDQPIRTWGGREYHVEPPIIIDGRIRTHEYKLLNVLVQGSSADCTKEAIIKYWEIKSPHVNLLLSVHDEILISAPLSEASEAMEDLRRAMEGIGFDVPMLSEGKAGLRWSTMRQFDKQGVRA
jgi:DNA polymerase I-like protein with 3'-5' exonuclease and polymerase domains